MKENGQLYLNLKAISSKLMMQEHFYALYGFTVQSNGGVATTPVLVDFEDLTYPQGRSYTPLFCIKMTAKDARTVIKNHFCVKIEHFRVSVKNLEGSCNHHSLPR